VSRSRRIDWAAAQKLGGFATVLGTMCLVAALALLVLIGLSPGAVAAAAFPASSTAASPTAATTTPASTPSCFPLTETSGTCYNAGEFCPKADLNMSGVAANGTPIACEPEANGTQPHWRDCTPASTATGTLVCPAARAGTTSATGTATTPSTSTRATTGTTTSATPDVTTGAPVGAPATGGGSAPGINGALAAAGCTVIVAGAGLVFLSRRRRTTRSP
jgi:hypothetical protein